MFLKKILLVLLSVFFAGVTFVAGVYFWVNISAKNHIYYDLELLPAHDVAVVLGTSSRTASGTENLFFKNRMDAAAELYHHGKVRKILVSGDNRRAYYNEPVDMKRALMIRGVPKEDIALDYAGFRTFDSMIRAKEVFGQERFIVVSQPFHLQRALFITKSKKIEAVGYAAENPSVPAPRTYLREIPARFRAFLDCYLLNTQPYFLGEKETI